jgi:hypothetical protein
MKLASEVHASINAIHKEESTTSAQILLTNLEPKNLTNLKQMYTT